MRGKLPRRAAIPGRSQGMASAEHSSTWQYRAAQAGHRHILQWAVDRGDDLVPMAAAQIACKGSIELMEWLEGVLRRQTPPTKLFESTACKAAFAAAAGAGALELLQWLR